MIPKFLLPERYRESFVIAGGWAACPALASDIDVWVLDSDPAYARNEIISHLIDTLDEEEYVIEPSKPRFLDGSDDIPDAYDRGKTEKVAVVTLTNGQPYHIMVTDGSVYDLIAGFDISTHQIALTHNGGVVRGSEWTPITYSPVILKMTPTTPARYRKICARYNHQPVEIKEAA